MKTLSFEQMEVIDAGGWLADAWNAVCDFFCDVWEWIKSHAYAGFEFNLDGDWDFILGAEW